MTEENGVDKRYVVICAYNAHPVRNAFTPREGDFVVCADGGYTLAAAEGIRPHLVMGDFDSSAPPSDAEFEVIRLPAEKDDTDTLACVKLGIARGYEDFLIVGGMGGRMDQTLANLQTLAYAHAQGKRIAMADERNVVTLLEGGTVQIPCREGFKLSLLAFSNTCAGVSVSGVKYPLSGVILKNTFPLGVSNDFAADCATVSVQEGQLLVILSQD